MSDGSDLFFSPEASSFPFFFFFFFYYFRPSISSRAECVFPLRIRGWFTGSAAVLPSAGLELEGFLLSSTVWAPSTVRKRAVELKTNYPLSAFFGWHRSEPGNGPWEGGRKGLLGFNLGSATGQSVGGGHWGGKRQMLLTRDLRWRVMGKKVAVSRRSFIN